MIDEAVRTLEVGTTDYVWAKVTERTGADVSAVVAQLRTVSPAGVVSAWANPADTVRPSVSVIRAAILKIAAAEDVGEWRLQAKLSEGSAVTVQTVGWFRVVA